MRGPPFVVVPQLRQYYLPHTLRIKLASEYEKVEKRDGTVWGEFRWEIRALSPFIRPVPIKFVVAFGNSEAVKRVSRVISVAFQ